MPKRPPHGHGKFYTRDSGGEHETTPGEYVLWARRMAKQLGVAFTGMPEQIERMIREGRFQEGDLFLDYGVKGNILQRRGLDALFHVVLTDTNVSHVFIPHRARFARPDDPLDGIGMETKLREAGVTLVFMDKILPPLKRGRRDMGEMITAMVDYDRAGQDRRDLAQKIIYAQINLAKAGFSTGGRPPFGFRRWLVSADGIAVRQLADGEYVQMAGHHVIWLPGPEEELTLIRRILQMLDMMPASRVAGILTTENVSTPDAGRQRTDAGVRHATSGVWHQSTVVNIARNPLLLAVVEHGRRSMGDQLRFTPDGPRQLEETDVLCDGKPKVVTNPDAGRVKAVGRFDPLVEKEGHQRLLEKLDKRSRTQRGKARSRDPSRNPLGGLIYDMDCTWPMYRQPYQDSFRYQCGLYQQSHGSKCRHNCVDGLVATRFLMGCVRQRLTAPPLKAKLEQKLRAIAERERTRTSSDADLVAKRAQLATERAKRERVGQNLAHAEGLDQYRAVAAVFEQIKRNEGSLEAEVRQLEQIAGKTQDIDAQVAAALGCLDRLTDLAAAPHGLASAGRLFRQLNARVFLRFAEGHWKSRVVNRVAGGVVTFGSTPPPVVLYDGPTDRRKVKALAAADGMAAPELPGYPGIVPGGEGISLGNVNRGERI